MALIESEGLMDNTYFLYSSDHGAEAGRFLTPVSHACFSRHFLRMRTTILPRQALDERNQKLSRCGVSVVSCAGFQLGEFNILIDKRQMYDHDTR